MEADQVLETLEEVTESSRKRFTVWAACWNKPWAAWRGRYSDNSGGSQCAAMLVLSSKMSCEIQVGPRHLLTTACQELAFNTTAAEPRSHEIAGVRVPIEVACGNKSTTVKSLYG